MTTTNDTSISGETRLKTRRNAFYRFCALGFVLALLLGFATGFASESVASGRFPAWSLVILTGLGLAGFVWFSVDYFRRIDELDMADNLWCSLVGLYFYVVALPVWQLFHDAGVVGEPQQWPIYIATIAVSLVAYFLRKFGLR